MLQCLLLTSFKRENVKVFSISDCITNCAYARLLHIFAIISLLLVCSASPITHECLWGPRVNPIAPMSYGDPKLTPFRTSSHGDPKLAPLRMNSCGDPGERCGVPNIENKKEKEK